MTNRRLSLFLALLLAPLASGCALLGSHSPVVDAIRDRGTLRVGMAGDYPPLNVIGRSGENIGLEPDLARALASSLRVELEIVNKPFAELLPALTAGEVDAVMSGMTMTPERNLDVAFVGPYLASGKAILSKSETLARVQNMDALDRNQISLVVLEGSTSQMAVERSAPNATLLTAPDYDTAVRMVVDGKADALFADYPVCVLSVLRNPSAGLAAVVSPISFEPIGVALPANDPLLVNLVSNYMKVLEGTGLLEQLRARWFDDASWLAELP